ncbi:MAG: hypothetical protein ACTHOG_03900 [Marmoricola sp.]
MLFVSDLSYQARGRRYCDEDISLFSVLREQFTVSLCHPLDAAALMGDADAVVVRNTGPVIHYREAYDRFRQRVQETGTRVFPQLTGRADQIGKGYLVDLTAAGYPVIPTIIGTSDLGLLQPAARYVVKPLFGADSVGLRFLERGELEGAELSGVLVQPEVRFTYEVSFYFVDRTFHYALHAPDPAARWALAPYEPTADDLAFAQRFIDWNGIDHGIQRVDACRTSDGELLLVELEDWNPYLSLDVITAAQREAFVAAMVASIRRLVS